jgi:hypothetical protein
VGPQWQEGAWPHLWRCLARLDADCCALATGVGGSPKERSRLGAAVASEAAGEGRQWRC